MYILLNIFLLMEFSSRYLQFVWQEFCTFIETCLLCLSLVCPLLEGMNELLSNCLSICFLAVHKQSMEVGCFHINIYMITLGDVWKCANHTDCSFICNSLICPKDNTSLYHLHNQNVLNIMHQCIGDILCT